MNLAKTIEKMKEYKSIAETDVSEAPDATRGALQGRQREAITQLSYLRADVMMELVNSSAFVLVVGSGKDAFTTAATETFGCYSSNYEGLYKDLTDKAHPSYYNNRESTASLFDVLGDHLEAKAIAMGMKSYLGITYKNSYLRTLNSKEELLSLVKTAINASADGDAAGELVAFHAVNAVVDKVIDSKNTNSIIPIILNGDDEKLALELVPLLKKMSSNVFLVTTGKPTKGSKSIAGAIQVKTPDSAGYEEVLKTIRSSLR